MQDLGKKLTHPIFQHIADVCETTDKRAFVVGGFVRDIFLQRENHDIDVVVLGNGIDFARAVADKLHIPTEQIAVYKTYGTAMFKFQNAEIEFVGARKESYKKESRNPIVETGTLEDDQNRRDFTINAMAIALDKEHYGQLIDPFNGIADIQSKTIRTPLDPTITFSDDPLRIMRAIRFATQLHFSIDEKTFKGIEATVNRLNIISKERINEELNKILLSSKPSIGFLLIDKSGVLPIVLPWISALKGVDVIDGHGHKEIFYHTIEVVDKVAFNTSNLWLIWAALFHDVGKPATKKYVKDIGWTFHQHEFVGAKMIPKIFRQMKMPMNEKMEYVQKLVLLHLRPAALVEDEVTDSAVRRLLFDAGDDIDDLMLLCEADITSKNKIKVSRYLHNFEIVRGKLKEIEEKDRLRNFQPPISGELIMQVFDLPPCREIGVIKTAIREAILDGVIANEYECSYQFMLQEAAKLGLTPKIDKEK
ncbi:MAG: HD domain-containing protein [Bacteroidales bacterium]|nr:HD domain-containing protein [Bacteroidales bacterium]